MLFFLDPFEFDVLPTTGEQARHCGRVLVTLSVGRATWERDARRGHRRLGVPGVRSERTADDGDVCGPARAGDA